MVRTWVNARSETCSGELPSWSLFALEMQLRVWFSDTAWVDVTAHPCQNGGVSLGSSAGGLYCSSPGAFEAAMDDVGWAGTQCWASKGPPGWSTSQWHLDHFVTLYARSSQLIDQPVTTVKGVKVLKQTKTKKNHQKKPSMLGCFSLQGLLHEQQKEGERGKLFTLFPFQS